VSGARAAGGAAVNTVIATKDSKKGNI